jgi:hypothetical protein
MSRFVETVGRTGPFGQCATAGNMVGMNMRIDDMGDAHAFRGTEVDITVEIPVLWINDCGVSLPGASQQICRATSVEIIKRSENHGIAS